MDWDHVRVFLAVADAGEFGRGALALGLSEATVGRQVAALERALNSRLFERLPNRVTVTTSLALFLTGHLERLLDAAGGVPLELVNTRAAQSLPQREAEIALRMRRPPERGELVVRRVGRGRLVDHHADDHEADDEQ